jgi:thioredoxin 1
MPIHVTTENFVEELLQTDEPILIDFYADWCIPCRLLSPILEEVSKEILRGKVVKVDVNSEPEIAEFFQIMGLPTLIVLEGGNMKCRASGLMPKQEILDMIEKPDCGWEEDAKDDAADYLAM